MVVWTRRQCIDALKRACADVGEGVSVHEYDALHYAYPELYPCSSTIRSHTGNWSKAITLTGYQPRRRGRPGQKNYRYDYVIDDDLNHQQYP
jgi:hypothetical protein